MKKDKNILVVACFFNMDPVLMYEKLNVFFENNGYNASGFLISSKNEKDVDLNDNWKLIKCSNDDLDFSAYMKGAEIILKENSLESPVIFLNDTLITHHSFDLNLKAILRNFSIIKSLKTPVMVGKSDLYRVFCLKSPWSGINCYISSYCFMVNIKSLVFIKDLRREYINEVGDIEISVLDEKWGGELNSGFKEFIRANLVIQDSPYLWYKLKRNSFNEDLINAKARAIYYEHKLSGSISNVGSIIPSNSGIKWFLLIYVMESFSRFKSRFL